MSDAAAPLTVIHVIPGEESGSGMPFSRRQVEALRRHGLQAEVYWLESRLNPVALLGDVLRLRRMQRRLKADVIHAQFGTVTALVTALAARVPAVITYRGSDLNPDPTVSWLRNLLQKTMSQVAALRADAMICVSEEVRGRLLWRKGRAVVMPTGFDSTVFCPRPRDEARSALGWARDDRIVLFNAGKAPALKRLDLAQATVDAAEKLVGPIRFVVMRGDVPPAQVPLYMQASDCLILASDFEGSPTVVQEAMACDLPVVSVPVGDAPERLAQVTPSAVCPRDPAAMGQALADILAGGKRSNGSAIAAQDCDQEKLLARIIQMYRDVRTGSASTIAVGGLQPKEGEH